MDVQRKREREKEKEGGTERERERETNRRNYSRLQNRNHECLSFHCQSKQINKNPIDRT